MPSTIFFWYEKPDFWIVAGFLLPLWTAFSTSPGAHLWGYRKGPALGTKGSANMSLLSPTAWQLLHSQGHNREGCSWEEVCRCFSWKSFPLVQSGEPQSAKQTRVKALDSGAFPSTVSGVSNWSFPHLSFLLCKDKNTPQAPSSSRSFWPKNLGFYTFDKEWESSLMQVRNSQPDEITASFQWPEQLACCV